MREIFAVTDNRENFLTAKISRYTVNIRTYYRMTPNMEFCPSHTHLHIQIGVDFVGLDLIRVDLVGHIHYFHTQTPHIHTNKYTHIHTNTHSPT